MVYIINAFELLANTVMLVAFFFTIKQNLAISTKMLWLSAVILLIISVVFYRTDRRFGINTGLAIMSMLIAAFFTVVKNWELATDILWGSMILLLIETAIFYSDNEEGDDCKEVSR